MHLRQTIIHLVRLVFIIHLLFIGIKQAISQCPPNIGFEQGTFNNWQCFIGDINREDGLITLFDSPETFSRHTLLQSSQFAQLDPYGDFPMNCPNGSGYSIRLGNSATGRGAERVSYTFTIPADKNDYSLIYQYAVVFQNPSHGDWEKPKFTANIYDVSTGTYIDCSSFSYTAAADLPGFFESKARDSVFCKSWTPVTIKLSGYAGRTIRLEFTTNDCARGGHFGYAYVDVNENCSNPIMGTAHCLNDNFQQLTAPYGFKSYQWFNADFSILMDTGITLRLDPVPLANTKYAVEITPFPNQGCVDTVYAIINYVEDSVHLKLPTQTLEACISNGIDLTNQLLTAGSDPNLQFSYFLDSSLSNFVSVPKSISKSGTYYIHATNQAGCKSTGKIKVMIFDLPSLSIKQPSEIFRPAVFNLAEYMSGFPDLKFSYWKDANATIPLTNFSTLNRSGTYYVKASNEGGCYQILEIHLVVKDPLVNPPNAFTPNKDGIHDTWLIPELAFFPECYVEIFSRYGQPVYKNTGYTKPWDGVFQGIDLPYGVYYYVIKLNSNNTIVSGSVTLIR